jgi:cell division protein FtsW
MLLVWFGIQAALAAQDRFSMLLAGGIAGWFGVQAVINLGGVTGLMPVTGLTLPFFSAGGSSLFVSMTAAGLLLNVARRGGLQDEPAAAPPARASRPRRHHHAT